MYVARWLRGAAMGHGRAYLLYMCAASSWAALHVRAPRSAAAPRPACTTLGRFLFRAVACSAARQVLRSDPFGVGWRVVGEDGGARRSCAGAARGTLGTRVSDTCIP